jgi:predicted metal-dependent hydrolase
MDYTTEISSRAKRLRIIIHPDGHVVVTIPHSMSITHARKYVLEKSIITIQKRMEGLLKIPKATKKDYLEKKIEAHTLVMKSLLQWNTLHNFRWNTVTIKNTSSRWGSCSKKGNLNFNYRIVYLPKELVDYLIVHELCHLQEMNHGQHFWNLVAQTIPNYKALRLELKKVT